MTLASLGTTVALSVINRDYDRQLEQVAREPLNSRKIEAFRERIATIETVDQFVEDYEIFSFVMEAFDLEDQIFGKALMSEMLKSDISDRESLAARLTDPRFRDLYVEMGFVNDGEANPNTASPAWQEAIIDRFLGTSFINDQAAVNEDLGAVLHFRREAPDIDSWFDVLKDRRVAEVLRKAVGLPDSMALLDLDQQIKIFESKMDIEDFKDPDFLAGIERKFSAISDAEGAVAGAAPSPILTLFQSNAQFTPVTLDLEAISSLRR